MGLTLEIRRTDGELVPPLDAGELAWELEESRSYHLVARESAIGSGWLDVRQLPRIDARTLALEIGFWTASGLSLQVELGEAVVPARIRVRPRSDKLDAAAWLTMLDDLDRWQSGLSVGTTGGTAGRVGIDGTIAPALAMAALLPLVPALLQALRVIAACPREHAIEVEDEVRLHRVRRADGATVSWLTRHGRVAAVLDGWRTNTDSEAQPYVPQWRSEDALDHPVNRYVAWALMSARARLDRLAECLESAVAHGDDDSADWCRARADAARCASTQLASLRARTFLRRIQPAPLSESALLAVRDDPTYARFRRLVQPFVNPRFAADPRDGTVPTRPSYDIYELWTFVTLTRALEVAFAGWRPHWSSSTRDGPGRVRDLAGTTFELGSEHGCLRLHFNRTFRSYFAADRHRPHSISGERRPDVVVEWSPSVGDGRWMFFDAKYRVGRTALYDAFESLHIYQHALVWPSHGGRASAGYLLVPAMAADTRAWFSDEFHATHACGCFVLRPEQDTDGIVQVIVELVRGRGFA